MPAGERGSDAFSGIAVTGANESEVQLAHRQRLFDEGVLIPTGVDGIYGRSARFEKIVSGIEGIVTGLGRNLGATSVRFPPVVARPTFIATGYLRSFPDMAGDVHSFYGSDASHRALLARLEEGRPYGDLLAPTQAVLCPAVCHPLYPTLRGPIDPSGAHYDVSGYVFRNEPSPDPARMMSFRQHDLVFVGDAEGARHHRDWSLERALDVLDELGLAVESTVANDPFFGRAGRMLATNQRVEELKFEVLAPTSPAESLTAIASANCHEDHFGHAFGLKLSGGGDVHTACFGFGLERITLALLWAHGLDPATWPAGVRRRLWP